MVAHTESQASLTTLRQACKERGVQLTTNRDWVLKVLHKARRPLSAYEIIASLSKLLGKPIGPPSVYRVLDLFVEKALLVRLESRNAYVLCCHLDCEHDHIIFSCQQCGGSWEEADERIRHVLSDHAANLDFIIKRQTVELIGLCHDCRA